MLAAQEAPCPRKALPAPPRCSSRPRPACPRPWALDLTLWFGRHMPTHPGERGPSKPWMRAGPLDTPWRWGGFQETRASHPGHLDGLLPRRGGQAGSWGGLADSTG